MALKRRIKKLSKAEARKISGRQYLICSECGEEEVEVPSDIGRVTCAYCVQKMVAPPPGYRKDPTGTPKPRGWHFKEYFEQDGVVYSRGEEVTDPERIAELKKASKQPKTVVKVTKTVKPKKGVKSKVPKTVVKKRGRKSARTTK